MSAFGRSLDGRFGDRRSANIDGNGVRNFNRDRNLSDGLSVVRRSRNGSRYGRSDDRLTVAFEDRRSLVDENRTPDRLKVVHQDDSIVRIRIEASSSIVAYHSIAIGSSVGADGRINTNSVVHSSKPTLNLPSITREEETVYEARRSVDLNLSDVRAIIPGVGVDDTAAPSNDLIVANHKTINVMTLVEGHVVDQIRVADLVLGVVERRTSGEGSFGERMCRKVNIDRSSLKRQLRSVTCARRICSISHCNREKDSECQAQHSVPHFQLERDFVETTYS